MDFAKNNSSTTDNSSTDSANNCSRTTAMNTECTSSSGVSCAGKSGESGEDNHKYLADLIERSQPFHQLLGFPAERHNSIQGSVEALSFTFMQCLLFAVFIAVIEEARKENPDQVDQTIAEVVRMAKTTQPIVHVRLQEHIVKLIHHKMQTGTPVEQTFYSQKYGRNPEGDWPAIFVARLLTDRPVVFYMASDDYTTKSGAVLHNIAVLRIIKVSGRGVQSWWIRGNFVGC
jgi:hypothetical protein